MRRSFDVIVERDSEGYYVGSVPALSGCHTKARSLDKLYDRLREAVELAQNACPDEGPRGGGGTLGCRGSAPDCFMWDGVIIGH